VIDHGQAAQPAAFRHTDLDRLSATELEGIGEQTRHNLRNSRTPGT